MNKKVNRHNTIFIILGLAGFLIFAALYGRLSPVSAIRMQVNEKEAVEIARAFFEQKGVDLEKYEKRVDLTSDGEQMMYLQKNLGPSDANAIMRERIPVYYWEVVWRRKGEFELVVGQEKKNVEISDDGIALKAKIDGNGNLFGFDYSIARIDTGGIKVLNIDEAYTLDEEYRKELFCQMAEILDAELPQIILWTEIDADGYSTRLEGVQATINDLVTWNVADWKIVEP